MLLSGELIISNVIIKIIFLLFFFCQFSYGQLDTHVSTKIIAKENIVIGTLDLAKDTVKLKNHILKIITYDLLHSEKYQIHLTRNTDGNNTVLEVNIKEKNQGYLTEIKIHRSNGDSEELSEAISDKKDVSLLSSLGKISRELLKSRDKQNNLAHYGLKIIKPVQVQVQKDVPIIANNEVDKLEEKVKVEKKDPVVAKNSISKESNWSKFVGIPYIFLGTFFSGVRTEQKLGGSSGSSLDGEFGLSFSHFGVTLGYNKSSTSQIDGDLELFKREGSSFVFKKKVFSFSPFDTEPIKLFNNLGYKDVVSIHAVINYGQFDFKLMNQEPLRDISVVSFGVEALIYSMMRIGTRYEKTLDVLTPPYAQNAKLSSLAFYVSFGFGH